MCLSLDKRPSTSHIGSYWGVQPGEHPDPKGGAREGGEKTSKQTMRVSELKSNKIMMNKLIQKQLCKLTKSQHSDASPHPKSVFRLR